MDMEQTSSEVHFTGADLCQAQGNQTVSLANTCQAGTALKPTQDYVIKSSLNNTVL
jgi:hypothetical protein